ncbi:MAG TPA: hypothetical protein VG847_13870 [Chitinophagaceae bacterium]|nr:hypothetical protein [Chitinophagaceae bacterium]
MRKSILLFRIRGIRFWCIGLVFLLPLYTRAQVIDSSFLKNKFDSIFLKKEDTALRIKNFSPYFTLHVDSTLDYQFEINKDPGQYYWYLKNSPVGLKINKDGVLHFKADKSYFLSGKLKYDNEYKVQIGLQNLNDPTDKVDTVFTLVFYNTEIIPSRIKPSVSSDVSVEEGDTLNFKLQCDAGSFPIESITYYASAAIRSSTPVEQCGDDFTWVVPYDFIKGDEKSDEKLLKINFIGSDKFFNRDTATIRVTVKRAINYPFQLTQYNKISAGIEKYIQQLKRTFMVLDRKVKRTQNTRTKFDLTSATTALGGTVFSSLPTETEQTTGKILPSVGVALVPVKEAVAPTKTADQNSASLVRSDIKRLEYLLTDNMLIGEKDPDIIKKTQKLRDELTQVQLQLIDVPIVEDVGDPEESDKYFNSPKVSRKYRLKDK